MGKPLKIDSVLSEKRPKERVYWHYWIFDIWEDSPEDFCLEEFWREHRNTNASRIPHLKTQAVQQLADWLSRGKVPKKICELAAEDWPCRYLEQLDEGINNARCSKISQESKAIEKAAIALERALVSASGNTLGRLNAGFYQIIRGTLGLPSLPENERGDNIFADMFLVSVDYSWIHRPNPTIISALKALSFAANDLDRRTPKDTGGAVSGDFDREGAKVKERLVIDVRHTLRNLGLPCGSQKNGPVSRFAALIHEAATGESAPWADKYAAMVPKLEKRGFGAPPSS